MEKVYKQLAERNGWSYSMDDSRPYFMKNGDYATPDETTSKEDKELLANIISEGSEELAQLILLCWDNNLKISGPCSGIRKFHEKQPFSLHFCLKAPMDIIEPLHKELQEIFPDFDHLVRVKEELARYDINYFLKGKELTQEESDSIFSIIRKQLELELENKKDNKR